MRQLVCVHKTLFFVFSIPNIVKHRLHVWLRGKQADLSFNPLIDQANMRRKSKAPAAGTEHTMVMDNVSDDFSDESLDPYLGHSLGGRDKGGSSVGVPSLKDPVTSGAKVSIESEKSSKIYSDGAYLPGTEDLGYQSASQSPNDSLRRAEDGVITEAEEPDTEAVVLKPNNLLKIENAIDPLSVSLPETFLKSVKTDLSQSIKSTASTKSRVHYDPRIFSSQGRARKQDPEKEYFEQMSRFYGEMNERFPSQAHNSKGAADSGHKVRFSGRPHILYLL